MPLLLPLELHQHLLLNQILHLKPELQQAHEVLQELEPTPRPLPPTAVTELRNQMNNAKEENAALTDADSTRPADLADSDLQELPLLVSRKDDATDLEFADQLSSNKTPLRSASEPMVLKDSAISQLVSAFNFIFLIHQKPDFSLRTSI